ncbi:TetR/AcrR family transcriptional regulator [Actinomadura chibensis]|uniref:TetR/AcrR family transcriptional regulator n=1 Tax=Actinomadura chibensis TaxID=392828 RepID=A0A5D0N6W0_9ACTN|nr:TetR/AcrR family transcriptional regulator [Actinomadura chibensis]TYB40066.1 TetR/AcrR family transcriptional regulator [Actinomadura chibensis]
MSGQPRRADARRNRERILQAAFEAFAADGRLVPLDDIARRAGVGAGTVYRNFPTKEALFHAVITERIAQMVDEAQALADADDPADAFHGFLQWAVERAMFNHALCDALAADIGTFNVDGLDQKFTEALDVLLRRAQEAGAVRTDVNVRDVRTLMVGTMLMERLRRQDAPPGRMTSLAFDALRPVTKQNETMATPRNETSCEICQTPITRASTGRPPRYCSPSCRQKAHRRRTSRT